MSKFCKNCGKELADEAAFCNGCGTSVAAEAVAETPAETNAGAQECGCTECNGACADTTVANGTGAANPVNDFVNKLKNKDKNALIIAGSAMAGLILLIVLVIVLVSGGPENAVDNYFEATYGFDAGVVEDLAPKAFWEYLDDEKSIDLEDLEEFVEDKDYKKIAMVEFESKVGDDVSFSYDIVETDEVGEKDLDKIKDTLKSKYDIPKKSIGEAVEIEIEIVIEGDDDEEDMEQVIYAVEIDGDWYPCTSTGKLLIEDLIDAYTGFEQLKDLGNLGDALGGLGDALDGLGDLSGILG